MKKLLLFLVFLSSTSMAQPPIIEGDTLLCPDSNGTAFILQAQMYDTYSWYTKYWFSSDPFELVEGVDTAFFTYDWYTYDQSLIKAVVTIGEQTYESNVIQIDSYAWLPITVGYDDNENISIDDNGNVLLCEGTSFTIELFNPYTTNIQWFKNDVPIPEANNMMYQISGEGTYYVTAAPDFCPENSSTSLPVVVIIDTECGLGNDDQTSAPKFTLYPNPATDLVHIRQAGIPELVNIYNMTGQLVAIRHNSNSIDVSKLAHGIYIVEIKSNDISHKIKLVKR